jgi:hypothetical protein
MSPLRIAAVLLAVLFPATIALLARLDHSVTADRRLGFCRHMSFPHLSRKESHLGSVQKEVSQRMSPVKQPLELLALVLRTGLILFRLHGENRLLFFLSPEVALANIMKLPSSPPGVHNSGSCCENK